MRTGQDSQAGRACLILISCFIKEKSPGELFRHCTSSGEEHSGSRAECAFGAVRRHLSAFCLHSPCPSHQLYPPLLPLLSSFPDSSPALCGYNPWKFLVQPLAYSYTGSSGGHVHSGDHLGFCFGTFQDVSVLYCCFLLFLFFCFYSSYFCG